MYADGFDFDEAEAIGSGSYVVSQGECIYSIAARSGHDWKTIWNHPMNTVLRQAGRDPGVLLPGDRVHIPEIEPKTIELATGRRHRIVVSGQSVELCLRMCDADGEPIAATEFTVSVGRKTIELTTDAGGQLKAVIPASATEAELRNRLTGERYQVSLGYLDPSDTASAIRKRLINLGYNLDDADGALDDNAVAALHAFCEDADLESDASAEQVIKKLGEKDPWHS